MRNLTAIAIIALALSPLCAAGQTTKTLTLSSNGVVSKPSDFWSVNAAGISSALSLGTAATSNATAFATAAQGSKADTAVQPTRTISTGTGMSGGGNLTGNLTLSLDSDLTALAAASGVGLWAVTGNGTGALRTLTAPAAGLTITNPAGTAGNPTFALANDLAAVEGLGGIGVAVRNGTDIWTTRSIQGTTNYITVSNANGQVGDPTINIGPNVVTTDTAQTITGNKTFSGANSSVVVAVGNGTASSFSIRRAADGPQPVSTLLRVGGATDYGSSVIASFAPGVTQFDSASVPGGAATFSATGIWTANNLTVNGNANLGDAAGDSHTVRGNMRGQDQTAAFADSYVTRQHMPIETIFGIWSFPFPVSASSVTTLENNGTFFTPVVSAGVRFGGGSGSANGTWSGATLPVVINGPGPGNIITPASNIAWEFTYSQGTNDGTVFTALMGTNNRRDLTAAGFGLEIATATGALTLKAHNGTTQSTSTVADSGGNLFFRRYILVWRASTNTVELYRSSLRGTSYERPNLMTSVTISAPSAWSSGAIRFGLFATAASVPGGQDSYISNIIAYQY